MEQNLADLITVNLVSSPRQQISSSASQLQQKQDARSAKKAQRGAKRAQMRETRRPLRLLSGLCILVSTKAGRKGSKGDAEDAEKNLAIIVIVWELCQVFTGIADSVFKIDRSRNTGILKFHFQVLTPIKDGLQAGQFYIRHNW